MVRKEVDMDALTPDMSAPLIHLRDVHLSLPGTAGVVNILNGIDLRIDAGSATGIIGASGSGKTSLLMVMAGLERATSGQVMVDGQDLTRLSEDELAQLRREKLGIVFQAFHLIPTMTALENVAVPLELAGQPHARARAAECLEQVGVGHRLSHMPAQLSGGEQQRVALARAFAPRPRLLLADEPTGNLDSVTGSKVMDLMFELRQVMGTTLVLITHDPALAARCSAQLRIVDGRVASGCPV